MAMGDKVCHKFVRLILHSGISFTAFCSEMSTTYHEINPRRAKFMSNNTFVNRFFAWAARFNIDFRQHVDPFCKMPDILACDDTHVGVTLSKLNIAPMEKGNLIPVPLTSMSQHRIYDRMFVSYRKLNDKEMRTAREHLHYLCKKYLLSVNELRDEESEDTKNLLLINLCPDQYKNVVHKFVNRIYSPPMLTALAKLLSLLASNASLCAIIPYDQASVLYNLCDTPAALLKSKDLMAPEILQVVRSSLPFNNNSEIVKIYSRTL